MTRRRRQLLRIVLSAVLLLSLSIVPVPAGAGGLGRALFRGASRGLARGAERGVARGSARAARSSALRRLLRRDMAAHSRARLRPLEQPRTVFRFTSQGQAQRELRRGIAPGHHMTSSGGPGRPLGATSAMKRFGLLRKPQVRETVRLPKGNMVRLNKVVGGGRGVGEATSPKRIPSGSIKRVVPLP
jgi:hypothetical protein